MHHRLFALLLIAHAPFLSASAAVPTYTPIAVPLAPVSKPLLNDKGQVLTVVTGIVHMYLPKPDYGRQAGAHAMGPIAAGGALLDFNTNGHFVTQVNIGGFANGVLYRDGATFTFPSQTVLGLDPLGRVLFHSGSPSIREVNGSVTTVPGGGTTYYFFNDINDAGIAVGYTLSSGSSRYYRTAIWNTKGGAPDFLPSNGFYTNAKMVNNKNQIFGHRDFGIMLGGQLVSTGRLHYIFLPAPDYGLPEGYTDLPDITALGTWEDGGSYDARLTDRGEIYIGASQNVSPTSIWYRGQIIKPSEHIVGSNTVAVTRIFDINNQGLILATGTLNGQTNRLFILNPNPLPDEELSVNVTTDEADADPNDGVIDVDLSTDGLQVSLRAAIDAVNAGLRNQIKFDIPGATIPTISPATPLPTLTRPVVLDATTQPGGRVGLSGALAGAAADGLRLTTSNSVVRGLIITKFQGAGMVIEGGSGHTISGNIVGTDEGGGSGLGNGIGLRMQNSTGNSIGGLIGLTRNIFSGNLTVGVALTNCAQIQMRANFIGTDPTGNASRPNGAFGLIAEKVKGLAIGISGPLSILNSPTAAVLRDIEIGTGGNSGGSIINCSIGLSASGDGTALGGTTDGLVLERANGFDIGGTDRNVFGGIVSKAITILSSTNINVQANYIGTDRTGNTSLPVGLGILADKVQKLAIGVSQQLSVINAKAAVVLRDSGGEAGSGGTATEAINATLINCNVGLNADGNASLGGTEDGVRVEGGSGVLIGGSSRNVFAGIVSNAVAAVNAKNVQIPANYIGTDRTGNTNLPVGLGILADKVQKLAIGVSNQLSVINAKAAVVLRDSGGGSGIGGVAIEAINATMINCNVGLNANGTASLGGTVDGVRIEGGTGVLIGGSARNVFAGIVSNAVAAVNATNVHLQANFIGTARSGNASLPVGVGVMAQKVHNLVIGMSNTLSVINGRQAGVLTEVTGSSTGDVAEGTGSGMINCHIGLNATGTASLLATTNGLVVERSSGFTIGGPYRNVFAGIVSNAVSLVDSTNIQLTGNYIGTSSSGSVSLPVGTGIQANRVRDLVIGISNQLSVINGRAAVTLNEVTGSGSGGGGSRMDNCHIGLNAAGTAALNATTNGVWIENSSGFSLGGIARNVLGAIRSNAVTVLNSTNIHVAANYIGTTSSGSASLPVGLGINADKVRDLIVGLSNQLSVINAQSAVQLSGISGSGNGGFGSSMDNCYVGLNAAGTAALATTNGVRIENSSGFRMGDLTGNILGGIRSNAVMVLNSTNIQVLGGFFGTDRTGSNRVANGGNNITVASSQNFSVGREAVNKVSVLLSGANRYGIEATDSPGLRVTHSAFGTDSGGGKAVSNLLSAIKVHSTAALTALAAKETTVIASNTIAFSGGPGVEFTQDAAQLITALQHRMERNLITYNRSHGVSLGSNVASVTIGGTNLAGANEISQNGGSGVNMTSPGDYNFVELNLIHSNVVKAVSRVLDAKNQTTMQIIRAVRGSTQVQGSVSGRPNETVRLHFYAHRPKPGAQGESQMWVGSVSVPLDGSGVGSYDSRLPRTTPAGWLVASTAADPVLGTSEFSSSQTVQPSTDTDGDGLPDFWEALYPSCLDPAVADPPTEDCDGDGFTNLQEYIAGTDPTQANSALRLANITVNGDGAAVTFTGIAGRQYGLDRQSPLGAGVWVRVATGIPEADGQVKLTDPNPPPSGNAFYRLVAEFP